MPLFETITDIAANVDKIKSRSYGMIEIEDEQLVAIQLRPWPKLISAVEAAWIGGWKHRRDKKNRCVLYYNQPMAHQNFLTLAYVQSTLGTSYASFRQSLMVLDHVAMIKGSDAILCEVTNLRISDRFLRRMGWERHMENSKKRHWIKRFYGDYQNVAQPCQQAAELSR